MNIYILNKKKTFHIKILLHNLYNMEINHDENNNVLICKDSFKENGRGKYPVNDSETQERGLWGVKIQIISWWSIPPDRLGSLHLWRLFRKSVSIYPRSGSGVGSYTNSSNNKKDGQA